MEKVVAELKAKGAGEAIRARVVDIADYDSVAIAAAETREGMGDIDILVNNAGIAGANAPTWGLSGR